MTAWFRRSMYALMMCLAAAGTANAQRRVPDKGMFAVTLNAGFALPADDVLEDGFFVAVSGEGYLTPRVSLKAQFGGAFFDVVGDGLDGEVNPWHLTGSVVYNWEQGKWHPYAGGGIGYYKYRFGEGDDRPTDSKFGVNLGGGVEYFFTRSDVILGDLTVHFVSDTADSFIYAYKPRYWTLSGGYKKYF